MVFCQTQTAYGHVNEVKALISLDFSRKQQDAACSTNTQEPQTEGCPGAETSRSAAEPELSGPSPRERTPLRYSMQQVHEAVLQSETHTVTVTHTLCYRSCTWKITVLLTRHHQEGEEERTDGAMERGSCCISSTEMTVSQHGWHSGYYLIKTVTVELQPLIWDQRRILQEQLDRVSGVQRVQDCQPVMDSDERMKAVHSSHSL